MNASSFGTMPKLETIRIYGNGLTDFPFDASSFIRMPMLGGINIESNEIRYKTLSCQGLHINVNYMIIQQQILVLSGTDSGFWQGWGQFLRLKVANVAEWYCVSETSYLQPQSRAA